MEKIHSDGDKNTRYIEKASMKMMDVLTRVIGEKPVNAAAAASPPAIEAPVKRVTEEGYEILREKITEKEYYIDDEGQEFWVGE